MSLSTETEEFWRGDFGRSYTARNRVEWESRIPFWSHIGDMTDAISAFEVGTNAGWNLRALRSERPFMTLCGSEINAEAAREAREDGGFTILEQPATRPIGFDNFDLVFSSGCLIHIPPEQLEKVMSVIIAASRRYVLAVEYADEKEVEIPYRGHSGKLWRRPFGKMYEDMGLKMVETGFLTKEEGFDNTTWWLLEK